MSAAQNETKDGSHATEYEQIKGTLAGQEHRERRPRVHIARWLCPWDGLAHTREQKQVRRRGEEVVTFRPEEQGTQTLLLNMSTFPSERGETAPDGGGLVGVVPGFVPVKEEEWIELHEQLKETKNMGVGRAEGCWSG